VATQLERVFNNGERLVPGLTFGVAELIRHRTSYLFFRAVIALDGPGAKTILDVGCGVGHGCVTLADLRNAEIVGVDPSPDAIAWAREHYARPNIRYEVATAEEIAERRFDYIVSRNALEHVADGIRLAAAAPWRNRLIFDVPYDEPPGVNAHHLLHHISEGDMPTGSEWFYQDINGNIHEHKPRWPNVIACVASASHVDRVGTRIGFPFRAWRPPAKRDRVQLWVERAQLVPYRLRRSLKAP